MNGTDIFELLNDLCSKCRDTVAVDAKSSDAFSERGRESLGCCKVKPAKKMKTSVNLRQMCKEEFGLKYSPWWCLKSTSFSFIQQWLPLFSRSMVLIIITALMIDTELTDVVKPCGREENGQTQVDPHKSCHQSWSSPAFEPWILNQIFRSSQFVPQLNYCWLYVRWTWQQKRYFLCQVLPSVDWSSWGDALPAGVLTGQIS